MDENRTIKKLLRAMIISGLIQVILFISGLNIENKVFASYEEIVKTDTNTVQTLNHIISEAYQYQSIFTRSINDSESLEDYEEEMEKLEAEMEKEVASLKKESVCDESILIKIEDNLSIIQQYKKNDSAGMQNDIEKQLKGIIKNSTIQLTYLNAEQTEKMEQIARKKQIANSLLIVLIISNTVLIAFSIINSIGYGNQIEKESDLKSCRDDLTGLWNRKYIDTYLPGIIRENGTGYLFMCDMDHFKTVNDSLGHGKGDEVLKLFADVCREALRPTDYACRLGGDEFMLYIPNIMNDQDAQKVAERVRKGIRKKFDGTELEIVTMSCGATKVTQQEFDVLYKKADNALYYVKEHGRNNFHIE